MNGRTTGEPVQDLLARLQVAHGDFVTLDHEQAALCREVMQRRIPITVEYPVVCCECGKPRQDDVP